MKKTVQLFFIFSCISAQAQDTLHAVNWSGMKLNLASTGGLGNKTGNAIIYPAASSKSPLKKLGFWVTAIRNQKDTLSVCADAFSDTTDWFPGPFGTGGKAHLNSTEWRKFYPVTAAACNKHKNSWSSGGYTTPPEILNWPSALPYAGFPAVCAPYVDYDQGGNYTPGTGDYPYVPGSENVFTMASDSAGLSRWTRRNSGLDAGVLWYQPDLPDTLPAAAFFRYTLCNRNSDTLSQMRISAVADFAIGNTLDDQLGTNVGLSSIYAYNQPGSDPVYGNDWPAVAVGWLSARVSASIYYMPDDGAVQGKPENSREFFHYAGGAWRSGSAMGASGSGLDASGNTSKFVYPGTTNPALPAGRDWTNAEGNAGRQTALISTVPFLRKGAGCMVLDGFVCVIAHAPDSAAIRKGIEKIRRAYDTKSYTLQLSKPEDKRLFVYPNPVISGSLLYGLPANQTISVYDMAGKKVYENSASGSSLEMPLKPGTYLLKTEGFTSRIVIVN